MTAGAGLPAPRTSPVTTSTLYTACRDGASTAAAAGPLCCARRAARSELGCAMCVAMGELPADAEAALLLPEAALPLLRRQCSCQPQGSGLYDVLGAQSAAVLARADRGPQAPCSPAARDRRHEAIALPRKPTTLAMLGGRPAVGEGRSRPAVGEGGSEGRGQARQGGQRGEGPLPDTRQVLQITQLRQTFSSLP